MDMTPLAARSLSGLLEKMTGQQLATTRRWRIETALQPVMREHGIPSLDALAGIVGRPDAQPLRDEVVEALLNHETSFYRDMQVFRGLAADALPAIAAMRASTRRIRIWSAGCSTGQEIYSIALVIAGMGAMWDGWSIDLFGTDVSPVAVGQARDGLYSQFEVQRGLPIAELISHFDQEGDSWRIKSSFRARSTFMVHNLLEQPPLGQFDMILCRNVLLYFSADRRRQVLDRLVSAIAPDGLLVLGAGETVLGQTDAFRPDPVLRGFYRPTNI